MACNYIEFSMEERVGLIRLNRPECGNAFIPDMTSELLTIAERCEADPEIRSVVLTGNGRAFCVGGDLKALASQEEDGSNYLNGMIRDLHAAISLFNNMDAPVISAINGTAAGGGLSLAIAADIAIAAESAKMTMAYTRAGLTPDAGSSYFLARIVGIRRAKEMALLNPTITAQQALEWGLVNQIVANDQLLTTAIQMAHQLADGPTRTFGETKRLILAGTIENLESQLQAEAAAIVETANSPEGREGIAAFAAKRKPKFG